MAAGRKAVRGSENFPKYGLLQLFYLWKLLMGFQKQVKNIGNPQVAWLQSSTDSLQWSQEWINNVENELARIKRSPLNWSEWDRQRIERDRHQGSHTDRICMSLLRCTRVSWDIHVSLRYTRASWDTHATSCSFRKLTVGIEIIWRAFCVCLCVCFFFPPPKCYWLTL